jgi:DNA-binding FadR family transcriptional regulator
VATIEPDHPRVQNHGHGLDGFPRVASRRSQKMAAVIAREIVRDIVNHKLRAGSRLPSEAAMLQQFQVGRATLREALRVLEILGLIAIRPGPGGGPVVAGADSSDLGRMATLFFQMRGATFRELAEARMVLEPLMARLAAERQDAAAMERLDRSIAAARDASVEDDPGWAEVSTDFHGVVAGLSGNRILDLFGEAIKEVWFDRASALAFPSEAREQTRKEHELIAKAIAAGDGKKAERLMRAHMEEFLGYVFERFPGLLDEVVEWR